MFLSPRTLHLPYQLKGLKLRSVSLAGALPGGAEASLPGSLQHNETAERDLTSCEWSCFETLEPGCIKRIIIIGITWRAC